MPVAGLVYMVTHWTSYSTLGPVSEWVGDRLWMGKPPLHRTRHPRLLSLSPPSAGRLQWVPGESWGSKQAHCVIYQPVSVVLQCGAGAWLKELASGDQRWPTGSGSALEDWCGIRNALYRSTISFTSLYYVCVSFVDRTLQTCVLYGMIVMDRFVGCGCRATYGQRLYQSK